jgi:hypothetical protein
MGEGGLVTSPTHRTVAGLKVPIELVPRIVAAIYARYPVETAGITDPDAAVRAALRAWVIDTLAQHEQAKARAPLGIKVAQTVTEYEAKGIAANAQAITEPTPTEILSEAAQILGTA